ncbi:MAG: SDR family oxidoreductase [Pyrodictiaceae archaeon]
MEKTVFVTGGSRGIGRAIVLAFAREGYNIFFTYLHSREAAKKVAEEAKSLGAGLVEPIWMDVADPKSVQRAYEEVQKRTEYLNVLVNNAAIFHVGSIEETSLEDWERVMRVNATGVFLVTKTFLPLLRKAPWASIVNIASIAGQTGHIAASAAYAASKAAVIGLTRRLAVELAPRIRVNAVAPSFVETDMVRDLIDTPEKRASVKKLHPLQDIAKPEDVAEAVLFLADPARSRFITGQVIGVNGGRLIC